MDAVKFIKEKKRMCDKHCLCVEDTVWCRMADKMVDMGYCGSRDVDTIMCATFVNDHPEEAVQVVEQWAKDNPREIDWMKVPVGTPVLVKNYSDSYWYQGVYEFALYLPNAPHEFGVLNDDRESATMILWYDFCKLADDVDPEPYYKD